MSPAKANATRCGALQISTSRPNARCQASSTGAERMTPAAPMPTNAKPSSARSGPMRSSRPTVGRPPIAPAVATRAARPFSATPAYIPRCGALQNVSRPIMRCHDTSHDVPSIATTVPSTPRKSGNVVDDAPSRRIGRAIVAMLTMLVRDVDDLDARSGRPDGHRRDDQPDPPGGASVRHPGQREPSHARERPSVHGLGGRDEGAGAPRLHLDEDPATRIPADEVELAVPGPDVPGDDPDTLRSERFGRDPLPVVPEAAPTVGHDMVIGSRLRAAAPCRTRSRPAASRNRAPR